MKFLMFKIKAGALQFAILISSVIAIIVGAFILLSYTQVLLTKKVGFTNEAVQLAQEGIDYAQIKELTYRDSLTITYNHHGFEEYVTLTKSHWGIFDKVISKGQSKNFSHTKMALLGGSMTKNERPAIYLEDSNTPLVVAGNTQIRGLAIVPNQGVKAGAIAGSFYQGKQLIYGPIRKIASRKPAIPVEKRNYIEALLFDNTRIDRNQWVSLENLKERSFDSGPQWVYRQGSIEVSQEIPSNTIIKSDTEIRITAFLPAGSHGAKAQNIICIAPRIVIEDSSEIQLQAIASESITVEKEVRLHYPSALILVEDKSKNSDVENQGILMKQGSLVEGSVVQLSDEVESLKTPKISIEDGATVFGEVYSDAWVELFGEVKGSVFVHQLASRVKGSVYKNHLFDAQIDLTDFPESYGGLMTNASNKTVIQWIH